MGELPIKDDIRPEQLSKAVSERYLAYALSTITQRALPDVRDGLKPVHRRILYAMRELGLAPPAGFTKSSRVVGDVIGKFHPHGDQALYDALVRLAQDFAARYPLVDGQGNFGNVDGDNPAAMRYTESRLTAVAQALLDGLDEDAVDFRPNYDGKDREPVVLPGAFPNLLANGSNGIAVGMATSIPPHNAGELCAAIIALIENPALAEAKLLKFVKGPDFPTGGIIVEDQASMAEAYRTGRGGFRVRARWKKEEGQRGTWQIVVDQIPYQVQKSKLIERLAELIEQKKLPMLDDVRDESAEDIRIVLMPKSRAVDPDMLMEQLFRLSDLETRSPLNMNVLDGGLIPRVMSLKDVLVSFINHRRNVLERRSEHRLEKIAARLEVLEGYLAVYLNLDKVIRIIRTEDEPKPKLMAAFKPHRESGRSDPQHAAALVAQAGRDTDPRRARGPDEGAEGSEEVARFRQTQIREADRGSGGRRCEIRSEDGDRQAAHDLRCAPGHRGRHRRDGKPDRERADHCRLFGEGLDTFLQGPSGTERRR